MKNCTKYLKTEKDNNGAGANSVDTVIKMKTIITGCIVSNSRWKPKKSLK